MSKNDQIEDILNRLLENAPAAGLSDKDVATLLELIEAFQGWKVLGRFTKWLLWALAAVAGAAVAWDTLRARVLGWLI